jgi:hypothetical protein
MLLPINKLLKTSDRDRPDSSDSFFKSSASSGFSITLNSMVRFLFGLILIIKFPPWDEI